MIHRQYYLSRGYTFHVKSCNEAYQLQVQFQFIYSFIPSFGIYFTFLQAIFAGKFAALSRFKNFAALGHGPYCPCINPLLGGILHSFSFCDWTLYGFFLHLQREGLRLFYTPCTLVAHPSAFLRLQRRDLCLFTPPCISAAHLTALVYVKETCLSSRRPVHRDGSLRSIWPILNG